MRVFIMLAFAFGITTVYVDGKRRSGTTEKPRSETEKPPSETEKPRSDTEKPRGESGSEKGSKKDCSCSSEVGRVCASDGDTYDSECHFKCENKSQYVRIISYEACKHKNGNYKRSKLEKYGPQKSKSTKGDSKKDKSKKSGEKKDDVHSSSESVETKVLGINLGNLRDSSVSKTLPR